MGGDFFDLHPAFCTRDKHRPPTIPIDDDAHIQFLGNRRAFFDQQSPHFPPLGTGLVGDERLADEFLDQARNSSLILRNLHAAGFPTTACMDLRLDHKHRGVELCYPCSARLGRGDLFPARNRNPELPEQLLGLKLMNVHITLTRAYS